MVINEASHEMVPAHSHFIPIQKKGLDLNWCIGGSDYMNKEKEELRVLKIGFGLNGFQSLSAEIVKHFCR